MIPNKNLQIDSAKMPHYLKKRYNLNKIMDIICPALAIEEKATKENIAEIIPKLAGKDDPFLILAWIICKPSGHQTDTIWNTKKGQF